MPAGRLAHLLQEYSERFAVLDRDQITCYNNPMSNTNNLRSLADLTINDASWIWVDDMIVFPDDETYNSAMNAATAEDCED
jgi:hypothetical protein